MKRFFFALALLAPLVSFSQRQEQRGIPVGINVITVSPSVPEGISNALYVATSIASESNPQLIFLPPGRFTNHSSLYFPSYVSMYGSGMDVSYIWCTNNSGLPPLRPGCNESFGNFTLLHTNLNYSGSFGNLSEPSHFATNCEVFNVKIKSTWVNLHFGDDDFSGQSIRYYNCIFESGYDNAYLICDQLGGETNRHEFRNCIFISDPLYPPGAGNGTAVNVRLDTTQGLPGVVGYFQGCRFVSKDGTNGVFGLVLTGLANVPPEAYLIDCTFDLTQTNLVAGGIGVVAVTNNLGICVIDGIWPTNRMMGDGTYSYRSRGNQASSGTSVATAANTTETDLMSYTIPAGILNATNQAVELSAWGNFGATANNKVVRIKVGGVTLLDTLPRANNAQEWMLSGTVQRVGTTTMKSAFRFEVAGFVTNDIASSTLDGSTNIVFRITGSNTVAAASDISLEGWKLKWAP